MKLNNEHKYIKIVEAPEIKYSDTDYNFDKTANELISIIIKNNTEENNKIIMQNLKTLKIKNKCKFYKFFINPIYGKNFKFIAFYELNKNKIVFYKNNKKIIGHELIHMSSTVCKKGKIQSGFLQIINLKSGKYQIGRGLTEGYTSLESDRLFGILNNSYYLEKDITKKLEELVGKNKFKKFFYTADLFGLSKELSKYDELDNIVDLFNDIDNLFNNKDLNKKKEIAKSVYLKLYKYNSIKRKKEYNRGLLSKEEYEQLTLNFGRIYLLQVMKLFGYEPVIEERERIL